MIRTALEKQVNRELKALDTDSFNPDKKQIVCDAWPVVEGTLTTMSQLIKTGWLLRLVFALVLLSGRALVSRFCKSE